ncbi:MAG: hypothetical protein RLZZ399_291 [Verrucomicrobiota bacterium]|jgi:hypothetical protein
MLGGAGWGKQLLRMSRSRSRRARPAGRALAKRTIDAIATPQAKPCVAPRRCWHGRHGRHGRRGRRGPAWTGVDRRGPAWTAWTAWTGVDRCGPAWTAWTAWTGVDRRGRRGPAWTGVDGVDRRGPAWTGVDRRGPAWTGVDRRGPAWTGVDRRGPAWTGVGGAPGTACAIWKGWQLVSARRPRAQGLALVRAEALFGKKEHPRPRGR